MSRMFLVWSLLFGLALVGADWFIERGQDTSVVVAAPADSEGLATVMDDGTPMPRPPK